jgi:uncharacterized protein YijF (DUF1287 family)
MKKAANRKPRHDARRAKARPARSRSRASFSPSGSSSRLSRNATRQAVIARVARYGSHLKASAASGAQSARSAIAWLRRTPQACARAIPIATEDREILVLLLAPFFILVLALAGNQSIHFARHVRTLIARPVAPVMLPAGNEAAREIALRPDVGVERLVRLTPTRPRNMANWIKAPSQNARPSTSPQRVAQPLPGPETQPTLHTMPGDEPELAGALLPVSLIAPRLHPPRQVAARPLGSGGVQIPALTPPLLANVAPERQTAPAARHGHTLSLIGPHAMDALVAIDDESDLATRLASLFERCSLPTADAESGEATSKRIASTPRSIAPPTWFAPDGMSPFGQRLAKAARRQLGEFTVYNDAYRRIAYPHGDVSRLYGVCTDVVIRAYRDVGIDLQVAVQEARVGSGDRSIDHRRTETLRRFFQRAGTSLPITTFAEDYLPGDIVTYARPQNTGTASRSHIALVADMIAPSGRPMIVHNRGWGPQLEDALFVDRITGHYRYSGSVRSQPAGEASTKPHDATRPAVGDRSRPAPSRSRRAASDHPTVR